MKASSIAWFLALMVAATPAARAAGDHVRGAAIAQQWCSACHATETTTGGTDAAPPWGQIALDPAKDDEYLKAFLRNPHPAMRHIPLTATDIDDLVAYIRTLAFE